MDAASARTAYARALPDTVSITRLTGIGAAQTSFVADNIRARVAAYQPQDIAGTVMQGDQKVILFRQDLDAAAFPVPPVKGDRITIDDRTTTIQSVDANTRKVKGEIIAYEIQVRGQ